MEKSATQQTKNTSDQYPSSTVEPADCLRILTCGSVDDGKSTLIGRLLWDSNGLPEDQIEELRRSGEFSVDGQPNFSSLLDGLTSEREQGITIDIAWRYFDTSGHRLVFIDSPGHEQYTRNMACGASHADVAILLVDARRGIKIQTRRHLAILDFMNVRKLILVINKMDLVDWDPKVFSELKQEIRYLLDGYKFNDIWIVPASALSGENVVKRSADMHWYSGPTLAEALELARVSPRENTSRFRMPVQIVLRNDNDFRGLAGTVASGNVRVGDLVTESTGNRSTKIARILTMDRELESAVSGQAIVIQLDDDLDVSRGSILSHQSETPHKSEQIQARIVWLSDKDPASGTGLLIQTGNDIVPISKFETVPDPGNAGLKTAHPSLPLPDIFDAHITLSRPVTVDTKDTVPESARFIIVDSLSGASVAAGIISDVAKASEFGIPETFILSKELLLNGICSDLADNNQLGQEFRRRADETAILLNAAGVRVKIELGS